jgi:hypothetical protein
MGRKIHFLDKQSQKQTRTFFPIKLNKFFCCCSLRARFNPWIAIMQLALAGIFASNLLDAIRIGLDKSFVLIGDFSNRP